MVIAVVVEVDNRVIVVFADVVAVFNEDEVAPFEEALVGVAIIIVLLLDVVLNGNVIVLWVMGEECVVFMDVDITVGLVLEVIINDVFAVV